MNEFYVNKPHQLWSALLEHGRQFNSDKETYQYIKEVYGVVPIKVDVNGDDSTLSRHPMGYEVVDPKKYSLFLMKYGHI